MNLEKNSPRKNDSWKWLLALVALIVLVVFGYDGSRNASPEQNHSPKTVSETVAAVKPVATPAPNMKPAPVEKPKPVDKPKQVERIAKIGVVTEYDYDHPILNDGGLCEFTIDNTRNNMPVYVRIWDVDTHRPVRAFTVAQGDKFTAKNLSPGTYEVRYKELYENDAPPYGNKSEPTTLEQYNTYSGINYDTVELTLYKVHGGNTTTTRIDADDV